jgi:arylsulfatase A-like enzyme
MEAKSEAMNYHKSNMTRRHFLSAATLALPLRTAAAAARRPNVVLIITDDQGFGDLSLHGNTHLQTPNMDRIAKEGMQFTQFQVCPVCSPTRASLMTGRYNYRTGIVDTYLGRSMMDPREVTAAEIFSRAGYKTGIFGKWHLGDNYPMRAMDQGFQESLVLGGGGLAQPADPPPGNHYFDPVLLRNGHFEKVSGYCTDIFFREATAFIDRHKAQPFFLYLPTNAPHTPLEIDDRYLGEFNNKGLDATTQRVYAMIRNLDDNIGRLLDHLKKTGLEENTILIFMTDNGPQQQRYVSGMRGRKGTVYQGGIRVPFFVRWPARIQPGATVDRIAAHIDVLPTLLQASGLDAPKNVRFDGRSLMPLIEKRDANWPDRVLHTQWHRGDEPVLFRSHAARTQRWKLVNGVELYDIEADPAESKDVAASHPDIVARLRKETEEWFRDVSATRGGYAPPRIYIGTAHENPVLLTRQDWRGDRGGWEADSIGHWEVDVREKGRYAIKLIFQEANTNGEASLTLGSLATKVPVPKGAREVLFPDLVLPKGPGRLAPVLQLGNKTMGVLYVEVRKKNG